MQYKVFFTTGQSILIREAAFNEVIKDNTSKGLIIDNSNIVCYLNMNHVTHIIPEEKAISNKSAVVTPPTPDDIKNEEKRKLEQIRVNPKALISRIKQKAEDE